MSLHMSKYHDIISQPNSHGKMIHKKGWMSNCRPEPLPEL